MRAIAPGALVLVVLVLVVAGCGQSGAACHAASDCASGLLCRGPNDGPVCGIAPRHGCGSDADCTGGQVCNAIDDPCSASGVGSECGSPCGPCNDGFRCTTRGACEPIPCDEGAVCAAWQRCDPAVAHMTGPVWSIGNGCVDVACTHDGDCGSGQACVNGYCASGVGHCEKLEAVP